MSQTLKRALKQKSENDINSFTWRDKQGVEVRMLDMTEKELQSAFNHCKEMLWNDNRFSPGKFNIRNNLHTMFDNCNAELFVRYVIHEIDTDFLNTNRKLREFVSESKLANSYNDDDSISLIFKNLPPVFRSITIGKLLCACFDKLEVINRKLISDKFIISQGIWLTDDEKRELTDYDSSGNLRNRLDVIKDRLLLNDANLRSDPRGFTYSEFRLLVNLSISQKVSSLSTNLLKTLRDKVIPMLDNDLNYHIEKWNKIIDNINKVAEYKQYLIFTD